MRLEFMCFSPDEFDLDSVDYCLDAVCTLPDGSVHCPVAQSQDM